MNNPPNVPERKDPTSFLPEEPMSYEIKEKKKKKKKKKKQEYDPFKDVQEKALITERVTMPEPDVESGVDPDTESGVDPEVMIKVEHIEVEINFDDFVKSEEYLPQPTEDSQEPKVKQEEQSKDAVLLTFESVVNQKLIPKTEENNSESNEHSYVVKNDNMCNICHLLFKTLKTLKAHQRRKHKVYRRSCKHVCDECGMSYQAKNSLVAHIKRRHGPDADNDIEERACDVCALVFKGMKRLRMHMRRKHGSFKESFKHACEVCGLTYEKYTSLLVHRRRKHSGIKKEILSEVITCRFCSKIFNRRETYARHIQRNHLIDEDKQIMALKNEVLDSKTNAAGEITCQECTLMFSTMNHLKLHMRRKHNALKEDFRLNCRICNMSYNNVESLKRHVKRKHDPALHCEICNKQFGAKSAFLNHSHIKRVKECSTCGLIFATQGGLRKHMRLVHKVETPMVAFCNICNEGFYEKRQLKPHLLREHYNVTYTCEHCEKVFRNKNSYKKHVTIKHIESADSLEALHKCELCTEIFTDEFEVCKHVNLVHRNHDTYVEIKIEKDEAISNPFHCTKCSDTFSSWSQLRSHYEQNHYVVNKCICQMCGMEVKEKELQKHIKQTHSKKQDLVCRFCDFKTKIRFTMTQHMLRHKNATTLKCDYTNCRYKTYYTSAMEKHKRRHKEQGVKFQCSHCPYQTMNKYVLKYHEEAHVTGKKRYVCEKCDYSTNLQMNLIQHRYKHSTEKRFKCELCPFASKYNTSLRFHVKTRHCDLPS